MRIELSQRACPEFQGVMFIAHGGGFEYSRMFSGVSHFEQKKESFKEQVQQAFSRRFADIDLGF